MVRAGCPLSGTPVALVVEIDSIRDGIEASCLPQFFHQSEQFILAEEAALRIVAHIFWTIEFRSSDRFQRDRLLFGKCNCVGQLGSRQAGGIGNDGQHILPQHLMCSPSEVGGIHTAGIGDQDAAQFSQLRLQRRCFGFKVHS